MHTRSYARLVLVSIITLLTLVLYTPAFAAQQVDPATLNPPIPPERNPTCKAVGSGFICDLDYADPAVVVEPTGILCGSSANQVEVVTSYTRFVQGKRYYDSQRNLTRRHFRDLYIGTLANPATGATLTYRQQDVFLHDLAVAGDIGTGTEEIAVATRLSLPGGGTVLIDAGRTVLDESTGAILFEAGQHPFDAYFVQGDTAALQPICDALT
jgi:hypothetical protein